MNTDINEIQKGTSDTSCADSSNSYPIQPAKPIKSCLKGDQTTSPRSEEEPPRALTYKKQNSIPSTLADTNDGYSVSAMSERQTTNECQQSGQCPPKKCQFANCVADDGSEDSVGSNKCPVGSDLQMRKRCLSSDIKSFQDIEELDLIEKTCRAPHTKIEKFHYLMDDLSNLGEAELIDYLGTQIIGRNIFIKTIYGDRLKLYVDYTASGQDLRCLVEQMLKIEEYYANTHTETSFTGSYMNKMLASAEDRILRECKASAEDYFFVGAGSGSTAAIEIVQKVLGTYIPPQTRELFLKALDMDDGDIEDLKNLLRKKNLLPLVIVSHYEHHSNEVTWRNQLCECIQAPFRMDGEVNIQALEKLLHQNRKRKLIGSFSAGSNVTGIKTDVEAIAATFKKYGGLCFYDYGALGPYVPIDLSKRTEDGRTLIDGIYVSPHKFLGGIGTCGVLIMSKQCYDNDLEPTHGGGGTVDYVGRKKQTFTENPNHREKSGTPGIFQIIKCGLVFELKGVLQEIIDKREVEFNKIFFERMSKHKDFMLLGTKDEHAKVTIQSFNIWMNGPEGKRWINPHLVIRLLNDLFGIQGRAGCSCAGPYGHYLLNIDDHTSHKFQSWIQKNSEEGDNIQIMGIKPGWARVNLHFSLQDYELEYLIQALEFICEHGYKFLPKYEWNCLTGEWKQIDEDDHDPKFGMKEILNDERKYAKDEEARKLIFEHQMNEAKEILKSLPESKGYDTIPEMEELCTFYVERGNIKNRDKILRKARFLRKEGEPEDIELGKLRLSFSTAFFKNKNMKEFLMKNYHQQK